MQNGKYYAILPLAILAIALGTQVSTQAFAVTSGSCESVNGGAAIPYGPSTTTRTSTDTVTGATITYTAQTECLFKGATIDTTFASGQTVGVGDFFLTSATCVDGTSVGQCADLGGVLGHLHQSAVITDNSCNHASSCWSETEFFADTSATISVLPADPVSVPMELISTGAGAYAFPLHGNGHANTVANVAQLGIDPPAGFGPVSNMTFSMAFKSSFK